MQQQRSSSGCTGTIVATRSRLATPMRRSTCMSLLVLFGMAFGATQQLVEQTEQVQLTIDLSSPASSSFSTAPFSFVGSGHASLSLRSDWRSQALLAQSKLGVSHIRFHGLLNDDMGPVVRYNTSSNGFVYNFSGIDSTFDFMIGNSIRPYVELSFMPSALASGNRTYMRYKANVTPPRSWDEWQGLITALARHWIQRYGPAEVSQWWIECWNEPNLKVVGNIGAFWTGTQDEYFELFNRTVRALKSVSTAFRVGGPVTSGGSWITPFVNYCERNRVPLDFISTHGYPTDIGHGVNRDAMKTLFSNARNLTTLPLVFSEYNSGLYHNLIQNHDSNFAAAFVVKAVPEAADLNIDALSYWTFSDIFDELRPSDSLKPFHNGFGMLTSQAIPKPVFRAFEMLSAMQGDRWHVSKSPHASRVDALCTVRNEFLRVLISSFQPSVDQRVANVSIQVSGVSIKWSDQPTISRIDLNHANPLSLWWSMGKPAYLTEMQRQQLLNASSIMVQPLTGAIGGKYMWSTTIVLPANGVALLQIPLQKKLYQ